MNRCHLNKTSQLVYLDSILSRILVSAPLALARLELLVVCWWHALVLKGTSDHSNFDQYFDATTLQLFSSWPFILQSFYLFYQQTRQSILAKLRLHSPETSQAEVLFHSSLILRYHLTFTMQLMVHPNLFCFLAKFALVAYCYCCLLHSRSTPNLESTCDDTVSVM